MGPKTEIARACWSDESTIPQQQSLSSSWLDDATWCCRSGVAGCFDESYTLPRCCHPESGNPWHNITYFAADLDEPNSWNAVRSFVAEHGRFDFVVCIGVLEALAHPQFILELLPHVAKAGYVAAASILRYHSGTSAETWVFSTIKDVLVGFHTRALASRGLLDESFCSGSAHLRFWWNSSFQFKLFHSRTDDSIDAAWASAAESARSAGNTFLQRSVVSGVSARRGKHVLHCEGRGKEHPQKYLVDRRYVTDVAFVTFVSNQHLAYLDSAVAMAQALKAFAPGIPRLALVGELDQPPTGFTLRRLDDAGWTHTMIVPRAQPRNAPGGCDDGLYGKVYAFNPNAVTFRRVVFLDSDTWVRSSRIMELLHPDVLPAGKQIAMVRDENVRTEFNTGVMVFEPNLARFEFIYGMVMASMHNDQPYINEAYEGVIALLPPEFNVHGKMIERGLVLSADAVIVHFTGRLDLKPTYADAHHLREMGAGRGDDPAFGLVDAGCLFLEFAKWLVSSRCFPLLSFELQRSLFEADRQTALHAAGAPHSQHGIDWALHNRYLA